MTRVMEGVGSRLEKATPPPGVLCVAKCLCVGCFFYWTAHNTLILLYDSKTISTMDHTTG